MVYTASRYSFEIRISIVFGAGPPCGNHDAIMLRLSSELGLHGHVEQLRFRTAAEKHR